jgi:hypothetical protein
VLGHGPADLTIKRIRELTDAAVLPIVGGSLLLFTAERYGLCFPQLCELIRAHQEYRYILTVGDYNDDERPVFYDLYSRYAAAAATSGGEVLLCAQTYAKAALEFRLFPTVEYHPLVTGALVGKSFVETGFGRLETSAVWYTRRNVTYVDPYQQFDGMTRRAELSFWYSPAGFLYLAHQATIIRAHKTKSRRVVVYSRFDLNSPQFLKLIFAFEAIGVELVFVYDEDFAAFTDRQGLGQVEIFSRAGNNSLVTVNGEAYYSDNTDVSRVINEAQTELIAGRGVHQSTREFMEAFESLISNADPQTWRRRGAIAKQMLAKFSSYPLEQQQVVLETYVERWRTL